MRRARVVRDDGGEIAARRIRGRQFGEKAVALAQHRATSAHPVGEAKLREIADARPHAAHPALAPRAAAHAGECAAGESQNRRILAACHVFPGKIIRFALECHIRRAAHRRLAEQAADFGVVGFFRDAEYARAHVASSGPCHDSSPSG